MQPTLAPYRPFAGGYVSEFDQFMDGLRDRRPDIAVDQHTGWYLWWDHKVDFDALAREIADHVPVKPYHYE
jgi:hypothetical protein